MNITDEMLYAAAPEAAERWLDALPRREDCGHDFSLTFEASMAPILRRRKRRWRTLALLAAVVGVLAALLAFGAGAERPDDYRVYAAQEDGYVAYRALPKEDGNGQSFHPLTLGWVPGEFEEILSSTQRDEASLTYNHRSENKGFALEQYHGKELSGILMGSYQMKRVQVGGEEAILFTSPNSSIACLLWIQGADAFRLLANGLEEKDLLYIARSLKW